MANVTDSLDEKITPGYWYRSTPMPNEKISMVLQTGHMGAKNLLKIYREEHGLSDEIIATLIEIFVEGQWIALSDVTIK